MPGSGRGGFIQPWEGEEKDGGIRSVSLDVLDKLPFREIGVCIMCYHVRLWIRLGLVLDWG